MTPGEADPVVRRLERNAVVWCLATSVLAWLGRGDRPELAAGILAGGALVGTSYWAIKSSVDALARVLASTGDVPRGDRADSRGRPGDARTAEPSASGRLARNGRLVWTLIKFSGRYALLGSMAYVMIARLRLHPIGLLLGASSMVAAATIEAIRSVATSWRSSDR